MVARFEVKSEEAVVNSGRFCLLLLVLGMILVCHQ